MLNVACVLWGDAFGIEYVERLADMVRRNLPDGFPGRFVCYTDRPGSIAHLVGVESRLLPSGLTGWWNKLALFRPDAFPAGERVLYFDLDTVIVGPLDRLAAFEAPFAALEDFYRGPGTLQSAVMSWIAGTPLASSIWEEFERRDRSTLHEGFCHEDVLKALWPGGDQHFLERFFQQSPEGYLWARIGGPPWPPEFLQQHFPGLLRSYKVDCQEAIPPGCSVVVFHGRPRPHEVTTGWVPELWKVGAGSSLEFISKGTISTEQMLANVRSSMAHGYEELEYQREPNELTAVIVGGGPSLKGCLALLKNLQAGGAIVFTVNGVERFLRERHLQGNVHVMVDGRPAMQEMVCRGGLKLYASAMDPAVLEKADADVSPGARLCLWHSHVDGIQSLIPEGVPVIAGGETVGLRALLLAHTMGFRRFVVMGFDSSYEHGDHHAYAQSLNDGERVLDIIHKGEKFKAAPWMVRQAENFRDIAHALSQAGCKITLFGAGLLQHMMAHAEPPAVDQRAKAILDRLPEGQVQGVEVGVFAGDLSKRLLRREDLMLYMVDSWAAEHRPAYALTGDFHAQLSQLQQNGYFERTKAAVAFAGPRAVIMREDSIIASTRFPDASLDFVFIDADHSYEGCKADILAWSRKVRPGGLICGHDYDHPQFPDFGVKRAVDELLGTPELGDNFTWFKRAS